MRKSAGRHPDVDLDVDFVVGDLRQRSIFRRATIVSSVLIAVSEA
jgi:hypothetical protein